MNFLTTAARKPSARAPLLAAVERVEAVGEGHRRRRVGALGGCTHTCVPDARAKRSVAHYDSAREIGRGVWRARARHPYVSTRSQPQARAPLAPSGRRRAGVQRRALDPAEEVALVARAKRELLLRVHRHRLRAEDLEDCYSQATLELVAHVRRGGRFAEQAASGERARAALPVAGPRSPARAFGAQPDAGGARAALSLDSGEEGGRHRRRARRAREAGDAAPGTASRAVLAQRLTPDQRLVLACQVGIDEPRRLLPPHGWSPEKYRKVAQRARARLRALMAADEPDVPPAARASDRGDRDRL